MPPDRPAAYSRCPVCGRPAPAGGECPYCGEPVPGRRRRFAPHAPALALALAAVPYAVLRNASLRLLPFAALAIVLLASSPTPRRTLLRALWIPVLVLGFSADSVLRHDAVLLLGLHALPIGIVLAATVLLARDPDPAVPASPARLLRNRIAHLLPDALLLLLAGVLLYLPPLAALIT